MEKELKEKRGEIKLLELKKGKENVGEIEGKQGGRKVLGEKRLETDGNLVEEISKKPNEQEKKESTLGDVLE